MEASPHPIGEHTTKLARNALAQSWTALLWPSQESTGAATRTAGHPAFNKQTLEEVMEAFQFPYAAL